MTKQEITSQILHQKDTILGPVAEAMVDAAYEARWSHAQSIRRLWKSLAPEKPLLSFLDEWASLTPEAQDELLVMVA